LNWETLEKFEQELSSHLVPPTFWANEGAEVEKFWKKFRDVEPPEGVSAGPHPHSDVIWKLLAPFKRRLSKGEVPVDGIASIFAAFRDYLREPAAVVLSRKMHADMKRDKLYVAGVDLVNAPSAFLLEYNRMEDEDPRVMLYRSHPVWGADIVDFGIFLDRFDAMKDVVCLFVWTAQERTTITLPCINLNPYPLCWGCAKQFGLLKCKNCLVARYCGRDCQVKEWSRHKPYCVRLQKPQRNQQTLSF